MNNRRIASIVLVLPALLAVGAGCASSGGRRPLSPMELRSEVRQRVPAPRSIEVPYEVTPELVERARDITLGLRSEHQRAIRLLEAITAEDGFGLEYEQVMTANAIETVDAGRGNCLSLTSVYVGLARALGLSAHYIDASDRVNDLRREEQLVVDSGHIAAAVSTERGWSMVDFAGELQNYRTFRVIDDVEALAHFYNNRGYEIIHDANSAGREVPWHEVQENFEVAALVEPNFARAHNNLGVVYARIGRDDEAGSHYRAAILADDSFAAPHHNLGNLALRRGDNIAAIAAYERAADLQPHNPYLHYHRGLAYLNHGDLEPAMDAFERSIALKQDYVEPRNALAQVYRQLGRDEDARRILEAIGIQKG